MILSILSQSSHFYAWPENPTINTKRSIELALKPMVRYNRGPDREKLQRLAMIMDDMVDWDRVKSKKDIITALFQGEVEVRPTSCVVRYADYQ
jgi:hypothetical protein